MAPGQHRGAAPASAPGTRHPAPAARHPAPAARRPAPRAESPPRPYFVTLDRNFTSAWIWVGLSVLPKVAGMMPAL